MQKTNKKSSEEKIKMAERIIVLRPHHIARFVNYHQSKNIFDYPRISAGYGKVFASKLKSLFDFIASGGTGEEYILVRNGLDSICEMCPIRRESCSNSDSLSIWYDSEQVVEGLSLEEGSLHPIKDFMERVKQIYPDRNPTKEYNSIPKTH